MKFIPDSETTRQYIIESIANHFNEKGYYGTSIADITKLTNLTKGAIYGNFKNKQDIAVAVLKYNLKRRAISIEERLSVKTSFKQKLITYLELFSSVHNKIFAPGGCPIMNTACETDDVNPELFEIVSNEMELSKTKLRILIKKGISSGEFKEKTDIDLMALVLVALVEGSILIGRTSNNKERDLVLEEAKSYIERACKA